MKYWIAMVFVACGAPEPAPVAPAAPEPAAAKAPEAPPAAPQERVALVKEVMNAERYTYALMDACGAEAWVAGPITELEVGQTMLMTGGTPMTDFRSKALDRTFDAILFVDGWKKGDKKLICPTEKKAAPKPVEAAAPARTGVVLETMDSGGYTYALLDTCGKKEWVAGPVAPVKVGQTVSTHRGSAMPGFTSKTLNRTFESIFFVQGFIPPAGPLDCE